MALSLGAEEPTPCYHFPLQHRPFPSPTRLVHPRYPVSKVGSVAGLLALWQDSGEASHKMVACHCCGQTHSLLSDFPLVISRGKPWPPRT